MEPVDANGHVVGLVSDAAQTDMALWDRALRGDERAFVASDRYAQRLLTFAYRRTGSVQRAEYAVSLVMLEPGGAAARFIRLRRDDRRVALPHGSLCACKRRPGSASTSPGAGPDRTAGAARDRGD